ncbi:MULTISPECIES: PadR family transcriptional regulator [Mycobacteroides]|uniref:PadR family transcriptional regulator n=1 Tax=Mycobacteroides chelonae TaxID=1774 RepID=A0A1S1M7S5_MYCCH|nr:MULTISPECIES: PadR family transcriptional regulator [Mycobacteroides]AYM40206.1 PadR family transcriptional regulator [[Mycobacterium] chelonae subsp. gwanakae]KRQ20105.1 PadR family transcriptional regulator [Mycobacteroides sp. H003]KRQ35196.1 PadR family transcriptional regulator [Mycobacteroides sp. H092]KRQ46647.1 PadR family transcriptional regulator [Mycobacteroides sp. H101]KRQ52687.1 PadR family transcriptional regulator [Mycobacteroides sp. H063]
MAATSSPDEPNLAATSWTILGMLSYEEEVSGYDIKKWADWSISYFYWSPSFSQIYSELRKLEKIGYATSRVDHDNGARSRRLYKITAAGMAAMNQWANETPAEPQVLKHSVVLRVMQGHMTDPARLKEILERHVEYSENMQRRAALDADGAAAQPAWAYSRVALKWAERYYAAERDLALMMIDDLAEAAEEFDKADPDGGTPRLVPGYWREVEKRVDAEKLSKQHDSPE